MTRDAHATLCAVTDALHEREAARLRNLRDEEARLRAALARLDAQARQARALTQEALRGVREIGADTAWQGWLAQQRLALQTELARVLARAEDVMPAQRRAFGKREAARGLRAEAQSAARARAVRRHDELLVELAVLTRMMTGSASGPDQVS